MITSIFSYLKKLFKIPKVTRVLFYAVKPDGHIHKTDFVLGLGPCGKTVSKLKWSSRGPLLYVLKQTHTDGSHKEFIFKKHEVLGRIVIETTS